MIVKQDKIKKSIIFISSICITAIILYFRLGFPGRSLVENDAVLYSEIVKIYNGINPFPQFTFKWSPLFLTGYYGWFLSDARVLVYFLLPFLKAQFYFTALIGIAVIFSTYRLAIRLYFDKKTALLAAFLVSIIPIHVSMSYGLSSEIPQTFLLLEAFNFLIDYLQKGKSKHFFISGMLFGFSILSKPLSFLMIPGICFLVFIKKGPVKSPPLKILSLYFITPAVIWLSWAIPSFHRIFGINMHSFSSFGFKVGSETMKIGLIESHMQILSLGGIFLLAGSLLCILWLRQKEDIFLLVCITGSLISLYFLRDVMVYWYPFIIPFYCIAVGRAFFISKQLVFKGIFLILTGYFITMSLMTDVINLDFDFNSQSGFLMRSNFNSMNFLLVSCYKNLDTVKKIQEIAREDDVFILSHTFMSYEGFMLNLKREHLPVYQNIKNGVFEYDAGWIEKVQKLAEDQRKSSSGKIFIVVQDGGYWYRYYDKGIWFETHQADILEANGFKKLYEESCPDKEILFKAGKYYRDCLSKDQWAKNYIFEKI